MCRTRWQGLLKRRCRERLRQEERMFVERPEYQSNPILASSNVGAWLGMLRGLLKLGGYAAQRLLEGAGRLTAGDQPCPVDDDGRNRPDAAGDPFLLSIADLLGIAP